MSLTKENYQVDGIYMNFKAFDHVPHNELLLKLHKNGISGNILLWFQTCRMAELVV